MNKELGLRMGTQDLKFAAAHMTLFPDGSKEPLHGHTYHVSISVYLKDHSFENMVPFSEIKTAIRRLCEKWHHKLLLPQNAAAFQIIKIGNETEFTLCKKHYVIPSDEVELLPCSNTSTEDLALEFLKRLLKEDIFLKIKSNLSKIEFNLDELPHQGAQIIQRDFE
ncbi:MAG: 6-carboxytetrahydropterin synthase [Deltaproteobacteria bacterium]|nr:6-carboxytetrahydropterin synthase [Deltaproteobacteria bacterium]